LATYKAVATIISKERDSNSILPQNPEKQEDIFKPLSDFLISQKIDFVDFWNFDEKGFQMGKGGGVNELVISHFQVKNPGK